jgi:hypothetical protein
MIQIQTLGRSLTARLAAKGSGSGSQHLSQKLDALVIPGQAAAASTTQRRGCLPRRNQGNAVTSLEDNHGSGGTSLLSTNPVQLAPQHGRVLKSSGTAVVGLPGVGHGAAAGFTTSGARAGGSLPGPTQLDLEPGTMVQQLEAPGAVGQPEGGDQSAVQGYRDSDRVRGEWIALPGSGDPVPSTPWPDVTTTDGAIHYVRASQWVSMDCFCARLHHEAQYSHRARSTSVIGLNTTEPCHCTHLAPWQEIPTTLRYLCCSETTGLDVSPSHSDL